MSMSSQLIKRGIALWKSGQQTAARKIFGTIIHQNETNETAWIWYIYTLETNPAKIRALTRFLVVFPQHSTARKALASLQEEERRKASTPADDLVREKVAEPAPLKLVPVQRLHPVGRSRSGAWARLLLVLGFCLFVFSSVAFGARYISLQVKYHKLQSEEQLITQDLARVNGDNQALRSENLGLSNQYNSLMGRFDSLSAEHSVLLDQYSNLNTRFEALSGEYDTLSAAHADLQNSYNILQSNYNNTVASYETLQEIAIVPPYIYTRERNVHLVFRKLDGSLLHWTISSDWLEHHLRLGDQQRRNLSYDLRLYNNLTDETYWVVDDRKFVDATPFTNLMSDLYRQSSSEYAFIDEVWDIVAQLTAYTTDMGETPRFPMETLLSGGGDCEDHAILLASMILASPAPWKVEFIYMDADHPTQPQGMNHVMVSVTTADTSYLVEATSKDSINPYPDGVTGWFYTISDTTN